MMTKIASFTFFTFLFFTVSAARLAVVDPAAAVHSGEDEASSKLSTTSRQSATGGSNILLPGQRPNNSEMDENNNNRLPESEKTTNDLTPQANFSRFHPINRHFHGKVPPRVVQKPRRPCKHPMPPQHRNPRIERYGETDDDVASERMINMHPKASRGDFQSTWFKAQHHHYGPRRYHGGNDVNEDVDVMMMNTNTKQVVDREKVKRSTIRQQKEKQKQKEKKKREEEAGFMRSIRKFLKHTFD